MLQVGDPVIDESRQLHQMLFLTVVTCDIVVTAVNCKIYLCQVLSFHHRFKSRDRCTQSIGHAIREFPQILVFLAGGRKCQPKLGIAGLPFTVRTRLGPLFNGAIKTVKRRLQSFGGLI
jgi:hypothetical protein